MPTTQMDWLHSPNASATMKRLLNKYARFFAIMAANPKSMAVPTLDVDLAWHTHQLSPRAYLDFSVRQMPGGKFVDHDDKVDEDKLSQAFEWTSRAYQDAYGEVYSECTCWYCEAIRASHVSSLGKLLPGLSKHEKGRSLGSRSSSLSRAFRWGLNPRTSFSRRRNCTLLTLISTPLPLSPVSEAFHTSGAAQLCPPDNSAHISSHPAVRLPYDTSAASSARSRVRAQLAALHRTRLEDNYQKAARRAAKRGRPVPSREQYYDHWGYAYYMYGPWMYPLFLYPGLYYAWDPGFVGGAGAHGGGTEGSGNWAACAQGSCAEGSAVAAGACGGPGGCGVGVPFVILCL